MNRREFLPLAAAGCVPAAAPAGRSDPPNIVVLLADDLGYGDVACQNPCSKIPTPNLDRLATQGMRFTDAHSPSAVCTPSRYGLLTGRYCWRSRLKRGVLEGYSPDLIEPGRATIASILKTRGYHTAAIGKWHLGLGAEPGTDYSRLLRPGPLDHGFDSFFGIPASLDMPPYVYIDNDRPVEPPVLKTEGRKNLPAGVFWEAGAIAAHFEFEEVLPRLTARTVRFLQDRAARPRQPFFLYFALTAPHTPWAPAAEFRGRSRAGLYGDFVAQVDAAVGQVLETLERTALAPATLVILTSDNGPERYAYDRIREFDHSSMGALRGVKRDAWEGGHRVPFLARWPGRIPAGATSGEIICLTDLAATCAGLAGAKLPAQAAEDSYSILPALLGMKLPKPIREATVLHTANGDFAIRQGDWVLIDAPTGMNTREPEWFRQRRGYRPHAFPGELYNLRLDPAQHENLYPRYPEIVLRLKSLLERYKREGRSAPRHDGGRA